MCSDRIHNEFRSPAPRSLVGFYMKPSFTTYFSVELLPVTAEVAVTARDIVVEGSVLHTSVSSILCESMFHT